MAANNVVLVRSKNIITKYPVLEQACVIVQKLLNSDQFLVDMFHPVAVSFAYPNTISEALTDAVFVARLRGVLDEPPLQSHLGRVGPRKQQKNIEDQLNSTIKVNLNVSNASKFYVEATPSTKSIHVSDVVASG
jgi:hypothetical protein